MGKKLNEWLDEFIENGFSVNVTNWPNEGSTDSEDEENSLDGKYLHTIIAHKAETTYYDAAGNTGHYVGSGSGTWEEYTSQPGSGWTVDYEEYFICSIVDSNSNASVSNFYSAPNGFCVHIENGTTTATWATKNIRNYSSFDIRTTSLHTGEEASIIMGNEIDIKNQSWSVTQNTIIKLDLDYVNSNGTSLQTYIDGQTSDSDFQFFGNHRTQGAYVLCIFRENDGYRLGLLGANARTTYGYSDVSFVNNGSITFSNFVIQQGTTSFSAAPEAEHIYVYQI